MRPVFLFLSVLTICLSAVPVRADTLTTWNDGTAYVKGVVIKHTTGCEVDGACSLIVNVNEEYLALVYAEGEMECKNTRSASWVQWGKNVQPGSVVQAYGSYQRSGAIQSLRFCDSPDFFIAGEKEPLPKRIMKKMAAGTKK